MPVDVQVATRSTTPTVTDIESWAAGALSEAPPRRATGRPAAEGELCVRVVDEAESKSLNREYRHKDAPTNVLSFPADVVLPETVIWGDVVVCAGVVQHEAAAQGKTYDHHFAHMVVHGVLHLLGYDHESGAEAAVMERLEREILGRFNISDPYREG
jgi:probable rRNA maturation factor